MGFENRYEYQDDITHVRKHVTRALGQFPHTTGVREIVDNAADEVGRGYATKVDLIYHDDDSIEVRDNGRGLEVSFYKDRNKNGIVASLGSSRAGENFSKATSTSGTHGEGAAATNFISQRMDIRVFDGKKMYLQQFRQGRPVRFDNESVFDPWAQATRNDGEHLKPREIDVEGAPETGTWIRFYFDPTIAAHEDVDREDVNSRARVVTWLTPGMEMTITENGQTEVVNPTSRGTVGVLKEAMGLDAVATFTGEFDFDIKDKSGNILDTKTVDYEVSIAPKLETNPISVVNNVYTIEGGQHADAALRALGAGAASKKLRALKRNTGEAYPEDVDFQNSVCVAVSVKYRSPSYSAQDKRLLAETPVFTNRMVKDLTRKVEVWAASPDNSSDLLEWAKLAQAYARTKQKVAAAKKSVKIHTGSASEGSNLSLPDKYTACKVTGPGSGAELYLCEGASAAGTVNEARYAQFQATYELRGKMVNVSKTSLSTLHEKEEFVALIALMNTGIGDKCDISKRRFDRVIMSCDADTDGYNINSSGINTFVRYFLPFVKEGRLYISRPPLFIVTSSNPNDRVMCINEAHRDKVVQQLKEAGRSRIEVQRCKGLGEMDSKDFRTTCMDPTQRVLYQVNYDEDRDLADLDLVFKGKPDKRRKWMKDVAAESTVDIDDILMG